MTSPSKGHPSDGAALSAGAKRMARYRNRRRKGLRCVTVELREREIEYLIRHDFLAPEYRADPVALRRAMHSWLDRIFPR